MTVLARSEEDYKAFGLTMCKTCSGLQRIGHEHEDVCNTNCPEYVARSKVSEALALVKKRVDFADKLSDAVVEYLNEEGRCEVIRSEETGDWSYCDSTKCVYCMMGKAEADYRASNWRR